MAAGILIAGVAGFGLLQVLKPRPEVRPPVKQLPLVRAAAVEFRSGALPVTGHGLVRPRAEVTLAAEVAGKVARVSPSLVTGGTFRRGDELVALDDDPFRAALAQAQADRQAAQAALDLAEQLLRRTEELIARGFLSSQVLDERVANRDQARAALARADAQVRQREIDLERTRIRAPFDGRVLSESVDAGDTVQPGRQLARIFDDGVLEVPVSLTDRDMALIGDPWSKPGSEAARATVTVEHGGVRYRWPARVDRVEAAVDSATRTFNVVVRVDEPDARGTAASGAAAGPPLLVGMYAKAEIAGRDPGRYAVLPRRALRDGDALWLLDAEDRIVIRTVRVLSENDETVAVEATGLGSDARIVVSDLRIVTAGMPVRVVQAGGDAATDAPAARP